MAYSTADLETIVKQMAQDKKVNLDSDDHKVITNLERELNSDPSEENIKKTIDKLGKHIGTKGGAA